MTSIEIAAGGETAVIQLFPDLSANTVAALTVGLPQDVTLTQAMWCGIAAECRLDGTPLADVVGIEHPVSSIYPGYVVAVPAQNLLLFGFGGSEYRTALGVSYATLLGRMVTGRDKFEKVLGKLHRDGEIRGVLTSDRAGAS